MIFFLLKKHLFCICMDIKKFISKLQTILRQELPGENAHLKMAPPNRQNILHLINNTSSASKAGVLVLIYEKENELMIPLIKRTDYGGIHSNQISLPGGKAENKDENIAGTALREAREEIGIDLAKTKILGNLSDIYVTPSHFLVTPVIGYYIETPEFNTDPKEVDYMLPVSINTLTDRKTIQYKRVITSKNINTTVPCFYVQDHIIWGATAMMISEFVELTRRIQ